MAPFAHHDQRRRASVTAAHPEDRSMEEPLNRRPVVVSILTWNQRQLITDCLQSIFSRCQYPNYRICVFDQACHDGTREYLDSLKSRIDVVHHSENIGFVLGNNEVFRRYPDHDVLLLNDDTIVTEGWLDALADTAYSAPNIGIVGSKLIYPNGVLQEAGSVVYQDASGTNIGKGEDPTLPQYNVRRDVDYCSGASIYIRRDALDSVGGQLDERFAPAYYEDTDLAFSVRQAGYRVVYEPRSVVFHREGATAGVDITKGAKKWQAVNRTRFLEKWGEVLRSEHRRGYFEAISNGKPKVLVIAKFPVMPDIASGELRLWRALQVLGETHQIVFLAIDAIGHNRYVGAMEEAGMTVFQNDIDRWPAFGIGHHISRNTKSADLGAILAHNEFAFVYAYFPDVGSVYLPIVRRVRPDVPFVVDSVDIVFLREWREIELKGDLAVASGFDRFRRLEIATYRNADTAVAVTEQDKAALLAHVPDANVGVITNVHPVEDASPARDGRAGLLFFGGYSHRPNVDAVVWLVREVMPLVWAEHPDLQVTLAGSAPNDEVHSLAGDRVIVTGWVPHTRPYLDTALISVAPLRYGAGMKGKVGEALAYGLPVVTTTIGAEGMDLADGRHALIADTAPDFAAAIIRLLNDAALWQQLSLNGRQHANQQWGFEATRRQWRDIIAGLPPTRRSMRLNHFDLRREPWTFPVRIRGLRELALFAQDTEHLAERLGTFLGCMPPHTACFLVIPPRHANLLVPWCEEHYIRYFVSRGAQPRDALLEAMSLSVADSLLFISSWILPHSFGVRALFDASDEMPAAVMLMPEVTGLLKGESWPAFRLRAHASWNDVRQWLPQELDARCAAINLRTFDKHRAGNPANTSSAGDGFPRDSSFRNSSIVFADSQARPLGSATKRSFTRSHSRLSVALITSGDALDLPDVMACYAEAARHVPDGVEFIVPGNEQAAQLATSAGLRTTFVRVDSEGAGSAIERILPLVATNRLMLATTCSRPSAGALLAHADQPLTDDTPFLLGGVRESDQMFGTTDDMATRFASPTLEFFTAPVVTFDVRALRLAGRPSSLESLSGYLLRLFVDFPKARPVRIDDILSAFHYCSVPWQMPDTERSRIASDLWTLSEVEEGDELSRLVYGVLRYGRLPAALVDAARELYATMRTVGGERGQGPTITGHSLKVHLFAMLTRAAILSLLTDRVDALGPARHKQILGHRLPGRQLFDIFATALASVLKAQWASYDGNRIAAEAFTTAAFEAAPESPTAAFELGKLLVAKGMPADAIPILNGAIDGYRKHGHEELLSTGNAVSAGMFLCMAYLGLGDEVTLESTVEKIFRENPGMAPDVKYAFYQILHAAYMRPPIQESKAGTIATLMSWLRPAVMNPV
jgi:GT2 family glycosyltransferase